MSKISAYKRIRRTPIPFMPMMFLAFLSINVLGLVLPLSMKKIYSTIIVERSVESLQLVLTFAFIALVLESVMRAVKSSSSRWIASKYEYRMVDFLTQKILGAHENRSIGDNYLDQMDRFKSVGKLAMFYSTAFYQLFIDVPFMFIFLYLIYIYGGRLVLVPILIAVLYTVVVFISGRLYFRSQQSMVVKDNRLLEHLTSSLEKIHLIKSAGIEETQIRKYREIISEVTKTEYLSNRYQILPDVLSGNISQLSLFMTLLGGGYMLMLGEITFAQITACALLSGRTIGPVKSVMGFYLQTRKIQLMQSRLDEISELQVQYDDTIPKFPSDIEGGIELKGVAYQDVHTDQEEAVDLFVEPGDFLVFHPDDFPSYKEVFRQISGRLPVRKGKVLIDNLDINEWNMHSLAGKIEDLREHVILYKGSVLDNITYFDPVKIQSGYDAAALVGLDTLVSDLAEGYNTEIDDHSRNYLSAAFLQRLNIARALVVRPRIILVDRIDEGMDYKTYEMFKWLMQKMKGESTVIMATTNGELLSLGRGANWKTNED